VDTFYLQPATQSVGMELFFKKRFVMTEIQSMEMDAATVV
jgi:hypothetical protein